MSYMVNELERVLVRLYIEKTLLEKGVVVYDSVCEHLYKNYKCYLEDCYEHPEYLVSALKEICRDESVDIILSIQNDLIEFHGYKRITMFLDALDNAVYNWPNFVIETRDNLDPLS